MPRIIVASVWSSATRNPVLCGTMQVQYHATYPVLKLTDDEDIAAMTSKSDVWKHEREYRFIGPLVGSGEATTQLSNDSMAANWIVSKENMLTLPSGALISVIVGSQMPVSGCVEVRRLIERYDKRVQFKRAVRVSNGYDLVIERA